MNIHFSGVGGIGMSALAKYFLIQGNSVSGSDTNKSDLVDVLCQEGLKFIPSHQEIPVNSQKHIYSEAIPVDDIQKISAKKLNIPSLSYFQALGEISATKKTLAICGTHGKSTCTAMAGLSLINANIDPLVIVGTKVREFNNRNIRLPENKNSNWLIVEACEYRESFLALNPLAVILTNCEYDHADYYQTENHYIEAYQKFVSQIPTNGFLVANTEDANVLKVIKFAHCKVIPVQFSQIINPLTPKVPGKHNQLNAELVKQACLEVLSINQTISNFAKKQINLTLQNYAGTWRRFDIIGTYHQVLCIDDYAHHPTEIKATLSALNSFAPQKRVVIVFQPHQYSRTREFFNDFVDSFALFKRKTNDIIFITNIYEARDTELDKKSVSAEKLVQVLQAKQVNAFYTGDYYHTCEKIKTVIQADDILLTMGAGPVNQVIELFKK